MAPQCEKVRNFVQILLKWAENNTRNFPWRNTRDAYRILMAEVMLQRTRVEQVVPVFERFMKRYPDWTSLSVASESDIGAEIQSLGLGKRASGLKKLAAQLLLEYNDEVPPNRDALMRLFGIGNYISNAVLCYAFGFDVPTVDSNFARVLVRVFSLTAKPPAQKDRTVLEFAESLMPLVKKHARELNLGIIDLAAKLCTPRNPLCGTCPLNSLCDYACE